MTVTVGVTLKNKNYIDFKISSEDPLKDLIIFNGVVKIGDFSKDINDVSEINFWDDDPFNTTGKYLGGLKFF